MIVVIPWQVSPVQRHTEKNIASLLVESAFERSTEPFQVMVVMKATDYPNRPGQQRMEYPEHPAYAHPADLLDNDTRESIEYNHGELPDQLYHVTTNRDKVLNSGLLSRNELHGIQGLGGGIANSAPNKVSTTWDYHKANQIENGLKVAARAARNEIPAGDIYDHINSQYDNPDDYIGRNVENHLANHGVPRHIMDYDYDGDESVHDHLDRNINNGPDKYAFMQGLDDAYQADAEDSDQAFPDRVGYTAPYEAMCKVDPDQIHTFRVNAHHGARPEIVPQEQEMRFDPRHLDVDLSDYKN